MVDEQTIREAGRRLAKAARSPARVILFGSHARGQPDRYSDLDFLVIEREVDSRFAEMVRLRDALPPLGVPVDVIVVSESYAQEWSRVPGTVVHEALTKGRVLVRT